MCLPLKEKYQNTTIKYLFPVCTIIVVLLLWQLVCMLGLVPDFMLPSPVDVVKAFINDFPLLMKHSVTRPAHGQV